MSTDVTTITRRAAILAAPADAQHYLRWSLARDRKQLYTATVVSPETWPEPHVALDAARSFLGESWGRLKVERDEATGATAWAAEVGTGEAGGCIGAGASPQDACLALWESVLGILPATPTEG